MRAGAVAVVIGNTEDGLFLPSMPAAAAAGMQVARTRARARGDGCVCGSGGGGSGGQFSRTSTGSKDNEEGGRFRDACTYRTCHCRLKE